MSQTDPISRVILYNPELFSRDELVRQFVVRTSLLRRLLADLPDSLEHGSRQHQLITGQRGMGKSTLLRRLQVAIREDATLSQVWVPLTFPEEQYNIDQPADLWLNCLDALGDHFERLEDEAGAERVDAIVERVRALPKAERGEAALRELLAAADRLERGFVLLIDNLDMVLKRLKEHHWLLRETLSHQRRLILIGTTAGDITELYDYDEAFYDFLKVHRLSGLTQEETVTLLNALGEAIGRPDVVPRVQADPGRLETLRVLTGGVPRIIAALFQVLATHSDSTIREDVEELLDKFSPYYKDRIEDLPEQAQQIFHAVAVAWDPTSAAAVADATGLPVGQVSAQLKRLSQNGVVDEVPLSLGSEKGYQLSERFFNIWYLFRASRRHRRRVSWLVGFLKLFYGSRLEDTARGLLGSGRLCHGSGARSAETMLGWSEAVSENPSLSLAFAHRGVRELLTASGNVQQQVTELLDLNGEDAALQPVVDRVAALETARKQIEVEDLEWPETSTTEFWNLLGGSPSLSVSERCLVANHISRFLRGSRLALVRTLKEEARRLDDSLGEEVAVALRRALREGLMESVQDVAGARAAAEMTSQRELIRVAEHNGAGRANDGILDRSEFRCLASLLLKARLASEFADPKSADEWMGSARFALEQGDFDQAEAALNYVIAFEPRHVDAWFHLGWLYQEKLGRYSEAEEAYMNAIECDSEDPVSWNNLGNLLQERLGRYSEAEEAYRTAIRLDPDYASPWNNLGNLLKNYQKRDAGAEEAYRTAINLDPKFAVPWNSLGNLLIGQPGNRKAAEEAYRTAIRIDPEYAFAWNNLGNLLKELPGCVQEAEDAYRAAVCLNPNLARSWDGLATCLWLFKNDLQEAEVAAQQAVALSDADEMPFAAYRLASIQAQSGKWKQCWDTARLFLDPARHAFHEQMWGAITLFFAGATFGGQAMNGVELLDELELSERWRPMRAALQATGEQDAESLLQLAPEVRGPAEELLRRLWPDGAEAALEVIRRKGVPRRKRGK